MSASSSYAPSMSPANFSQSSILPDSNVPADAPYEYFPEARLWRSEDAGCSQCKSKGLRCEIRFGHGVLKCEGCKMANKPCDVQFDAYMQKKERRYIMPHAAPLRESRLCNSQPPASSISCASSMAPPRSSYKYKPRMHGRPRQKSVFDSSRAPSQVYEDEPWGFTLGMSPALGSRSSSRIPDVPAPSASQASSSQLDDPVDGGANACTSQTLQAPPSAQALATTSINGNHSSTATSNRLASPMPDVLGATSTGQSVTSMQINNASLRDHVDNSVSTALDQTVPPTADETNLATQKFYTSFSTQTDLPMLPVDDIERFATNIAVKTQILKDNSDSAEYVDRTAKSLKRDTDECKDLCQQAKIKSQRFT